MQDELKEILENMEYQVTLLGGPHVGKTSLLTKINSNHVKMSESQDDSIASISQEMIKHTLISEDNEEVKICFVSFPIQAPFYLSFHLDQFSLGSNYMSELPIYDRLRLSFTLFTGFCCF